MAGAINCSSFPPSKYTIQYKCYTFKCVLESQMDFHIGATDDVCNSAITKPDKRNSIVYALIFLHHSNVRSSA